ncbi:MarC family protein [Bradyrhizobium liaoningense]|uniref:MarC family protein n=1 Tax=Bradyrhizobium liaoningense TaxID=43992 RepID=UPI001BAAC3E2|nr:MarC family protein [Bradyrhizobium liaoningense]MBR0707975.1 MarC family protein [Bradyrhizobium liaoningense]
MSVVEFSVMTFATLFVAIGPVDTAIVFGGLTGGVHRPERFRLAFRAVLIAGSVLLGFALFGVGLLAALHVSLEAFRFAGGVLLLLQGIQLIFGHPAGLSTLTAGERREALEPGDIAIFPLAFPVIAGPAGLTAVVLLMGQASGDLIKSAVVLGSIFVCLMLTYGGMIFTDVLHRILKTTGANVIARLAGVILAGLAAQYIFDAIREARILSG